MTAGSIVIATPHARYDLLEQRVRQRLQPYRIERIRGKADLSVAALERLQPAFVFFPHWSWIVPAPIYTRFSCVIFHMTDVPYGRGGSPLQNLIVRGHRETKLTALQCTGELDAGPVYAKRPLSLDGTAEDILQRAAMLMEDMIVDIVETRPAPVPQEGAVVLFQRRTAADGNLAPLQQLTDVYDFIRMLDADGYPKAFLDVGRLHVEFRDARMSDDSVEARVRITRRQDA